MKNVLSLDWDKLVLANGGGGVNLIASPLQGKGGAL